MQEGFPQEKAESNSARKRRLAKEHNARVQAAPKSRNINDLTSAELAELNALSKDVFGASSRWQKLITKGYSKLLTEEVTELVPGKTDEDEATERKVQVPLKRHDGAMQSVQTYHTVDSIKEYMTERKAQLDTFRAMIKKQQEDAQKQREKEALALKVNEAAHGAAP